MTFIKEVKSLTQTELFYMHILLSITMLKLAIAAGITLSAFLCGMMALRSSNLFQNSQNVELINDIKEVFGLPPISSSNFQLPSKSGVGSSFSFAGEGGYLPPRAQSEDDNSTADLTTPVFRIFIVSTSTTANTSPTIPTTPSDIPTTQSSTTPSSSTSYVAPNETLVKEETLTEGTTVASVQQSPTPYAFQGNPSPAFKIDLVWSTLTPPSLSNSENEVVMNEAPKTVNGNAQGSGSTLPNNGLYLPPNKEYLPPKQ